MAQEKIEGRDWNKEVQKTDYERAQVRREFYEKRAKLKLNIGDLDDVLNDPHKYDLKTLEDLKGGDSFEHEVKSGDTLFVILKNYFEGRKSKDSVKDVYLSLHYLSDQNETNGKTSINVDLLQIGDKITVKDGMLSLTRGGKDVIKDASLRVGPTEPESEPKPEDAPPPPPAEPLKPPPSAPPPGPGEKDSSPRTLPPR